MRGTNGTCRDEIGTEQRPLSGLGARVTPCCWSGRAESGTTSDAALAPQVHFQRRYIGSLAAKFPSSPHRTQRRPPHDLALRCLKIFSLFLPFPFPVFIAEASTEDKNGHSLLPNPVSIDLTTPRTRSSIPILCNLCTYHSCAHNLLCLDGVRLLAVGFLRPL